MNNEELNEKTTGGTTESAGENAKEITEPSNKIENETDAPSVNEAVDQTDSDEAAERARKEDHFFSFSRDVSDDLLSEIFDDDSNKKKKRKKNVKKPKKAVVNKSTPKPETKKTFLSELFDWVEIIALSAAFVLVLFTFVMRLAIVDGPSMENTLHDDEMLIISGLFYTPECNDIIVFNSPNFKEPIVKRIIATENQTVDIDFETWTVTVDGKALKEDYVKKELGAMKSSDIKFPLTVPEGYVFVMGDNRNDSLDSRNSLIGLVDERYILGEVKIRVLPFNKFGKVD